jgi:hypothetical protein
MVQLVQAEFVPGEAILNITYAGCNSELPQPVMYDATDPDILRWATEAIRAGLPGIEADPNVDLSGYVVERFAATATLPDRIFVRPKTAFGDTCHP